MQWVEQSADRYLAAIATSAGRPFRYRSRVGELLGRPAVESTRPRTPRRPEPELLYRAGAVLLAGPSGDADVRPERGAPAEGPAAAGSSGTARPPRPADGQIQDLAIPGAGRGAGLRAAGPRAADSGPPGTGTTADTGPGPSAEPGPATWTSWTAVGAPVGRTPADARDLDAAERRLGTKGPAGQPGPVARAAGPRQAAPAAATHLTAAGETVPDAGPHPAGAPASARPAGHARPAASAGAAPAPGARSAPAGGPRLAPPAAGTGPDPHGHLMPSWRDARPAARARFAADASAAGASAADASAAAQGRFPAAQGRLAASADDTRRAPAAGHVDPAADIHRATRLPGDPAPVRADPAAGARIGRLTVQTAGAASPHDAGLPGPAATGRPTRPEAIPPAARGHVPAPGAAAVPRAGRPLTRPAPVPAAAPAMPRRSPLASTAPAARQAPSPPASAAPAASPDGPRRTTPPSSLVRVSSRVPTRTVQWWGQSQLRRVGLRGPR